MFLTTIRFSFNNNNFITIFDNFYLIKEMIRSISTKADVYGAIASLLCLAHCFATPILLDFFSHNSVSSELQLTPIWWETLDFKSFF